MTVANYLPLALLLPVIVVAGWRKLNPGLLAFIALAVLLAAREIDAHTIAEGFPTGIVLLVLGATMLLRHGIRSGIITDLIAGLFRIFARAPAVHPWIGFAIAAALTTAGAFATAPISVLVPLMAVMDRRYPRSYFLNSSAVAIGANAAALSPLNPAGVAVRHAIAPLGSGFPWWLLWLLSMAVGGLLVAALQVRLTVIARREDVREGSPHPSLLPLATDSAAAPGSVATAPAATATPATGPTAGPTPGQPTTHPLAYRISTSIAFIAFTITTVTTDTLTAGVTALGLAALLAVLFHTETEELLAAVPWSAVLTLTGMLIFVHVLAESGSLAAIGTAATHVPSHALLVLLIVWATTLICSIESSTLGGLTLVLPIAASVLGAEPGFFYAVVAIAITGALTITNPLHAAGALILSNYTGESQKSVFGYMLLSSVLAVTTVATALGLVAAVLLRA